MYCAKHLLLLAICVVTLGSASESQFLDYSLESLDAQEILDRQSDRNDKGFQLETEINSFHSNTDEIKELKEAADFYRKGRRSYSRKSAYY